VTPARIGFRWTVCALLFVVTTVNYVDRQVLSILAPSLQRELHWSETDYGDVVSWFSLVYACGFLVAGRWLDRVGVRRGFAVAVVAWSVAAIGHAFARTTAGFAVARALLGLGESANFPGAIKTLAEWFPKSERALAAGIFNAGTNTGAIVAPLLVPWIALSFGWRWAFIITGCFGFLWLALWLSLYRSPEAHPRLSPLELAHIRSDPPDAVDGRVPWIRLLGRRQTWAVVVGKLMTDPIWLFYLFWLPKFLDSAYGIKLSQMALPLVVVYVVADIGSVSGGWLSSRLINRGGEHVDRRAGGRRGGGRPSGLVRQRLYAGERHVSPRHGGLRDRDRGLRRRDGWSPVPARDGADPGRDRPQLHTHLPGLRLCIRVRVGDHTPPRPRLAARAVARGGRDADLGLGRNAMIAWPRQAAPGWAPLG